MGNKTKQKRPIDWLEEIYNSCPAYGKHISPDEFHQAKEMEDQRMIELIQFIVGEKELADYGSVSKETAKYYLDKFNSGK